MLFTQRFWPGLADGSITLTFRTWKRAQVKVGGRYHSPVGQLEVHSVRQVRVGDISAAEARRAGQPLSALLDYINGDADDLVWRVEFSYVGADPRIALRADDSLSPADIEAIVARLARLDRASKRGAWTADVLRTIRARPAVRAGDLADDYGLEMLVFKTDVRKLKALGLTESLDVGYRLSPRGEALLRAIEKDRLL